MDTKETKLIDVLPQGWITDLAAEFGMARKNMALVLSGEINSERAKLIRSQVKSRLESYYLQTIEDIKNIECAS